MSVFGERLNRAFLSDAEYAAIQSSQSTSFVPPVSSADEEMEVSEGSRVPDEGIIVMRGFVVYHFDPQSEQWSRLPDTRRDRSYFETVFISSRREIVAIR